jgi:hypothetical protein
LVGVGCAPGCFVQWDSGEDSEGHVAWARTFADATAPLFHRGVHVNFVGTEGTQRVYDAYRPVEMQRLRAVKRQYDPGDLFRFIQKIAPSND